MFSFVLRRVTQSAVVLAVMSVLVFFGIFAVGDPVEILVAPDATQAERERVIADFGLDRPVLEQYGLFVINALHGDLGRSFVYNEPAMSLIWQRLPATFELALVAVFLTAVVGLPLGLWAGLKPNGLAGRTIMAASILGFSLPAFWVALMLIMIFAVWLGWLPASGRGPTAEFLGIHSSLFTVEGWEHLAMPAFNLALANIALVIRLTRAGVTEAIQADFVRFARAKGVAWRRIILTHVLKSILVPIVTVLGLEFGAVMAFAVVTESIFAWPGMGKLIIDSIYRLDRPVVVAYLLFTAVLVILVNLLVDLTYSVLDPRVRLKEAKS
jgi:peptide/nickel transport system permease protein